MSGQQWWFWLVLEKERGLFGGRGGGRRGPIFIIFLMILLELVKIDLKIFFILFF